MLVIQKVNVLVLIRQNICIFLNNIWICLFFYCALKGISIMIIIKNGFEHVFNSGDIRDNIQKKDFIAIQIKKENSACGFCRWNCWCVGFHVTTDTTFAIFSLKSVSKKCCQLCWAAGEEIAPKLSVSCSVSFPLGLLGICRTPLTTSVQPIKSAVKKHNSAWYCLFQRRHFTPWSFNLSM